VFSGVGDAGAKVYAPRVLDYSTGKLFVMVSSENKCDINFLSDYY
jgi:hypothetical protein